MYVIMIVCGKLVYKFIQLDIHKSHNKKKMPLKQYQKYIDLILIDLILVFNATFNSISAISWRPVLVVEEAGVPGENHRPWASNW